jgi:hypothetical protein
VTPMHTLLLFFALASSGATQTKPAVVTRATIIATESNFDKRFEKLFPELPYLLLGNTRGVYLEGYGVVFSAEVNLIVAGGTPFRPKPTKEEALQYRQQKLTRIPVVVSGLRQAMLGAAQSLDTVPVDENVVFAVSLFQHSWEEMEGVPHQLVLSASRKSLLQAQITGNTPGALNQVVTVREY